MRVKNKAVARLHVGAVQVVLVSVGLDVGRVVEVGVEHIRIVVGRYGLVVLGPTMRAAHELQPAGLARHRVKGDPDRTQLPALHVNRPEGYVLVPGGGHVAAGRLYKQLVVEVSHGLRPQHLGGYKGGG